MQLLNKKMFSENVYSINFLLKKDHDNDGENLNLINML